MIEGVAPLKHKHAKNNHTVFAPTVARGSLKPYWDKVVQSLKEKNTKKISHRLYGKVIYFDPKKFQVDNIFMLINIIETNNNYNVVLCRIWITKEQRNGG